MIKIIPKIANPIHLQILDYIQNYQSKSGLKEKAWVQHYLGSNKPTQCIKTNEIIILTKNIIKQNSFDSKKLS